MKKWIKIERIPGVLAFSYEKATKLAIESYYHQVAEEVVSVSKEGTILDLGTGPGNLPLEIIKREPGIQIVGVDLSRQLIRIAVPELWTRGLSEHILFEVANASNLRFNDDSFDMAISTGILHSLRKPSSVWKEMYRVLKQGGDAWIYDPARIIQYIDKSQWRASLNSRERFFLWLFGLLGLQKPIAIYSRDQVIPLFELTPRLALFGQAQYDTDTKWEGLTALSYMLQKNLSLIRQCHSDYGFGGGLQIRF